MATFISTDKSSETDRGSCLSCGIQTSSHCKGCAGVRPGTKKMYKAYFCGRKCQDAGWQEHKAVCKQIRAMKPIQVVESMQVVKPVHAVKQLYRAGELLQKIFYIARVHTFDIEFDKVEKRHGKMHIYQSDPISSAIFQKFPEHLVSTAEDREVIMSYLSCGDAIMAIHAILPRLLEDLCASVRYDIVSTPMLNIRQKVVWHSPRRVLNEKFKHEVCRLDLKTGGSYILDLAAAQYGYHAPVYAEGRWKKEWQPTETSSSPFHVVERDYGSQCSKTSTFGMKRLEQSRYLQMRYGKEIDERISDFEKRQNMPMKEALKLEEGDFQRYCSVLTSFVDFCLKLFREQCIKIHGANERSS